MLLYFTSVATTALVDSIFRNDEWFLPTFSDGLLPITQKLSERLELPTYCLQGKLCYQLHHESKDMGQEVFQAVQFFTQHCINLVGIT